MAPRSAFSREGTGLPGGAVARSSLRCVSPPCSGDTPEPRGPPRPLGLFFLSMVSLPRGKAAARPRPCRASHAPSRARGGTAPFVTPSAGAGGRRAPLAAAAAGGAAAMAAASVWKGLVGLGLFALAHAAFSAAQHRSYMRLTEKEDETLPIDIVLQTLLAFAVTCYGIVHIAGEFKDMDATSELKNKTFDTLRNHPSFYVFNHRGRVLFQSPDTVNSSSNQDALSSSSSLKFRKLEPLRR
ncbi:LOW QUALITY PROTEIN: ER membrane protein complex subunit 5 [Phalacrocorax aristotelis]|uniref:LOW QUALITY PROTEIN: ER membrane protein complex subunit 5 n=1 Tax=Phalacrocorax aristotelis TaxID=126867 RepID=UPI003F4C7703